MDFTFNDIIDLGMVKRQTEDYYNAIEPADIKGTKATLSSFLSFLKEVMSRVTNEKLRRIIQKEIKQASRTLWIIRLRYLLFWYNDLVKKAIASLKENIKNLISYLTNPIL